MKKYLMLFFLMIFQTILFGNYDNYYYAKDKKIDLVESKRFVSFKVKGKVTTDEIKKQIEFVNESFKINRIIKDDNNHVYIEFNNVFEIDGLKNALNSLSFVEYITPSYHINNERGNRNSWPLVVEKEFVVMFKENITQPEISEIIAQNDLSVVKESKMAKNLYILRSKSTSLEIANRLFESNAVIYSEPHFYLYTIPMFRPNDTYFPSQWHLASGTGGVKAEDAWDITQGSSAIKIAIVDDGMDLNHEDLTVVQYENFTRENFELSGDHGTACAGIAAGKGHNSRGTVGLCMNCQIMSGKMMAGPGYTQGTGADGIEWATDNGADIISNSWGYTEYIPCPSYIATAVDYATSQGRDGKGSVVVFASGNDYREFYDDEMPALPKIISVGASTYSDVRSEYSNYGSELDIIAPSSSGSYGMDKDNTWTTDAYTDSGTDIRGYNHEGWLYQDGQNLGIRDIIGTSKYTKYFGGTSSACPLVSGLAGLILSKNNTLTYTEVRQIIEDSADKIGGASNYIDGHSKYYGYGRINAKKALELTTALDCIVVSETEICGNNKDDECDGKTDSLDEECLLGNNCINDKDVISRTGTYTGNTTASGYTNEFTAPSSCTREETLSKDIVYEIRLLKTQKVTAEITDAQFDSVMYLQSTCGGTTIECNDDISTDVKRSKIIVTLTPGTYFLIIDGFGANNHGPFSLKITFENPSANICDGVACSSHGTCEIQNELPVCICDDGFYVEGLSCIPDENICDGITCSNKGTCKNINGSPLCVCNNGYHSVGMECIIDDLCTGISCTSNASCDLNDGICYCDIGYYLDETTMTCEQYDPNSACAEVRCGSHEICNYDDGLCHCNENYIMENENCVLDISGGGNTAGCSLNDSNSLNFFNIISLLILLITIITLKNKKIQ